MIAQAAGEKGIELLCQGKVEEAVQAFHQEIETEPGRPDAYLDLSVALRLLGRREEAIEALRAALHLRPGWGEALHNLGTVHLDTGNLRQAMATFREALALHPSSGLAHSDLGLALLSTGDSAQATSCFERALTLDPSLHFACHFLRSIHWRAGELERAVEVTREGLHGSGDCRECHMILSIALLTCGDYSAGWKEYEWRWHDGQPAPLHGLSQPVWDGSSLAGKTIVLCNEQGIGDILHFVRFASLVHERGGTVVVLSRPNLDSLLATCRGVARVVSNVEELEDFDWQVPMASLPRILGTGLNEIPNHVPYLSPPAGQPDRDPFGPRQGDELRVGIVWGVEPGHPHWEKRSCPISLFRRLEEVPDVELYGLQFGQLARELLRPDAPRAADLSSILGDFGNTAALVDHLDLVVTVDTSMAHLAGALGKPVWTLLGRPADWRWLRDREDTPWYPTMRLFRQDRAGEWEPVMQRVVAALHELREDRRLDRAA